VVGGGSSVEISHSVRALPKYAFYSVVRLFTAYALSLIFAVAYGYAAANSRRAERVLLPVLDILQSYRYSAFLPAVMLAMISLFPYRSNGSGTGLDPADFHRAGLDMAFSFYSSMKAIPPELREVTRVYGYSVAVLPPAGTSL